MLAMVAKIFNAGDGGKNMFNASNGDGNMLHDDNVVNGGKKSVMLTMLAMVAKLCLMLAMVAKIWGRIHERSQVSNLRFFLDFSQI